MLRNTFSGTPTWGKSRSLGSSFRTRPVFMLLVLSCWILSCCNLLSFFSHESEETSVHISLPPPPMHIIYDDKLSNLSTAKPTWRNTANDELSLNALAPTGTMTSELPPPEEHVVIAIFPVTEETLSTLATKLTGMLSLSKHLHEIVLVCPASIQPGIRDILHQVLPDTYMGTTDVIMSVWPTDLDEGAAVLFSARHLDSPMDRLLVLDCSGLDDIDEETRNMLVGPLATPLPVGPRGFRLESVPDPVCLPANNTPDAASFLLPPFSISPLLIPPHELDSDPDYDVWSALGKHISHARYENVGGVAVDFKPGGSSWCLREDAAEDRSAMASATDATDPRLDDSNLQKPKDQGPTALAVILSSMKDLLTFVSPLCRMQHHGHHVFILLLREDQATQGQPSVLSSRVQIQRGCSFDVTFLSTLQTLNDTVSAETWMSRLPIAPVVLVTTPDLDVSPQAFHTKYISKPTIIRIPREDLPYCDWMATLTLEAWCNWYKPRLEISVITNDRPKSLSRLLSSMTAASFFGDTIDLRINIEQTADAKTLQVVDDYRWKHGTTFVHRRVIHGGLLPAVVESWYPTSNDSYGLMLEDDVELSPLFYAWIKMSLLHYRYGKVEDRSPQLFGISLYQQKNLELRPEGRHRFNARTIFEPTSIANANTPYLSQIPCSWGAVYFPEHWREFHEYLSVRLSSSHPNLPIEAVVAPGLRSNKWTRSWKKYFIELVYLRGYVMLYPNFKDYISLSTNHLEVGSHVKQMSPAVYERKKKLFLLPLMERPSTPSPPTEPSSTSVKLRSAGANPPDTDYSPMVPGPTDLMDVPDERMPAWDDLPVMDLLGLLATETILQQRGAARRDELFHCVVPDMPHNARSLVCLPDLSDPDDAT